MSLLKIYTVKGSEFQFAYQYTENFKNIDWDLQVALKDAILPFFTEQIGGLGTVTVFDAIKVNSDLLKVQDTYNEVVTNCIIDTVNIDINLILTSNKGQFYYLADQSFASNLAAGIYYVYLTDGINIFISDLFKICNVTREDVTATNIWLINNVDKYLINDNRDKYLI